MAAASYYHDELNLPTKPGFANEMQILPSPVPDYNRPFQPSQQILDPHVYAPSTSVPPTPKPEEGDSLASQGESSRSSRDRYGSFDLSSRA